MAWFAGLMVMAVAFATGDDPAEAFAKHVVVAQEGHAAEAGREALRAGGNAVDAAVATAFALAVTHPAAGNVGGGGFLVAFEPDGEQGRVTTFDFREAAPASASERMYLDSEGKLLPRHRAGPRAAGVPGTVAGLALAHRRLGTRPWGELVRPAVKLAREGFPISKTLARSLNAQLRPLDEAQTEGPDEDLGDRPERLADFPASVAAYGKPDGSPWAEGDILKQPDLAATLERIAKGGAEGFYGGETAEKIVAAMEAGGGTITAADLRAYRAIERPPVRGTFRGCDIYGMGPPASGGVLLIEMLNVLGRYDLKADGPRHERTVHRVTEAMRRAFFDRATRIADPGFASVGVDRLITAEHADALAATIGERATPSVALAPFAIEPVGEGAHTTHLSAIDGRGGAVALTYTLEEGYGSKAVVAGAGFLLNNEMGDFNLIPGRTDAGGRVGTEPNRIAPGKRMLSSQSPTIAVDRGKVRLVTGSPGGRTIPNTTLWVVLNVLEFGLEPRAAVDGLRTHHQWLPDLLKLEGDGWDDATRAALEARGHTLGRSAVQGDAHTIVVEPGPVGRIFGVADRRRQTSRAAGD